MASNLSKHLLCAITQELMVDPVLAEDGNTYERKELIKWLATNSTSPLDPSCSIDASQLRSNRAVKKQIEELIESRELSDELCADYTERQRLLSPENAQELFDEGKVEEAADLGHAEAQGMMADRYYFGSDGVDEDLEKCVEWAKKAAAGGDRLGQYWLGYAYQFAEGGVAKDWAQALEWYEKAAEQGHATAMNNMGFLYEAGGRGVTRNLVTSASWYRQAAEAGDDAGQCNLAVCYYQGDGVTKDLSTARSWCEKSADQGYGKAVLMLGAMLVKGEGGARDINLGCAKWAEVAAGQHDGEDDDDETVHDAQENLETLYNAIGSTEFK